MPITPVARVSRTEDFGVDEFRITPTQNIDGEGIGYKIDGLDFNSISSKKHISNVLLGTYGSNQEGIFTPEGTVRFSKITDVGLVFAEAVFELVEFPETGNYISADTYGNLLTRAAMIDSVDFAPIGELPPTTA